MGGRDSLCIQLPLQPGPWNWPFMSSPLTSNNLPYLSAGKSWLVGYYMFVLFNCQLHAGLLTSSWPMTGLLTTLIFAYEVAKWIKIYEWTTLVYCLFIVLFCFFVQSFLFINISYTCEFLTIGPKSAPAGRSCRCSPLQKSAKTLLPWRSATVPQRPTFVTPARTQSSAHWWNRGIFKRGYGRGVEPSPVVRGVEFGVN
jgi:hypothetical protein